MIGRNTKLCEPLLVLFHHQKQSLVRPSWKWMHPRKGVSRVNSRSDISTGVKSVPVLKCWWLYIKHVFYFPANIIIMVRSTARLECRGGWWICMLIHPPLHSQYKGVGGCSALHHYQQFIEYYFSVRVKAKKQLGENVLKARRCVEDWDGNQWYQSQTW